MATILICPRGDADHFQMQSATTKVTKLIDKAIVSGSN